MVPSHSSLNIAISVQICSLKKRPKMRKKKNTIGSYFRITLKFINEMIRWYRVYRGARR